jgi:fibronectin type III domain protein
MQKFVRIHWSCALIAILLFSAAQARAQSVTLAWDPNAEPDIGGYLIGYGTVPGQDHQLIDVGGSTLWTIHGVSEGTTYYFRVYAYNTVGMRSAPSADLSATVTGTGGSPGPGGSGGGCATPDPFTSIGGGTCSNGAWTPAGFNSPNPTPPSTPPATPPSTPPAAPPSTGAGCAGSDPFTSLGGGTCFEGGWLPPGMAHRAANGGGSGNGCHGPDPFVSLGGGTCSNGGWLPPGLVPGGNGSAAPTGCSIPDPFVGISGLIGVCQNGGWRPVPGISMTGTIRVFSLSETFWGIAGDDGRVYRPSSLDSGLQVEGLQVVFQGSITGHVMTPSPVTLLTVRSIVAR